MNNITKIGRFAPSPSGILHLGNLVSSFLAWADARSEGGRLIFRLEDLDPARSDEGFARAIADDLSFLGLDWDEGYPDKSYCQSERSALYEDCFSLLDRKGLIYPCYCSRAQRLAASAPHPNDPREYGCSCRSLSASERRELEKKGHRPAWKVCVPDETVSFTDGHYGHCSYELKQGGDFIVKRSDGVFAYQLAVSADDADMGITSVVRGRDLLDSTAKQIWLIRQLGGAVPSYSHAPLVAVSEGRKLSKRDGDLNMLYYRERLSPEELTAYIARLIGIYGGTEPITAGQALNLFRWENVIKQDIIV